VALATLGLTILGKGKIYAALEARSMIAGAAAFLLYAIACGVGIHRPRSVRADPLEGDSPLLFDGGVEDGLSDVDRSGDGYLAREEVARLSLPT
jgi:hypothetical protein